MNLALCIEKLVPAAEYFGSVTSNTREAYEKLEWLDSRKKPTWDLIASVSQLVEDEISNEQIKKQLAGTDLRMPRDTENLFDKLVEKNVLSLAEMPSEFRDMYSLKRNLRGQLK